MINGKELNCYLYDTFDRIIIRVKNNSRKMKLFVLSFGILLILNSGCHRSHINELSTTEKEIVALESITQKRDYLENIYNLDQEVRGDRSSEIMIEHGKDSQKFREYIAEQLKVDQRNLNKIETYIKIHDHPNRTEVGEIAAITPWVVIHHAQGYQPRERNFKVLYKAYKNNDIDDGQISMFLGRMYQLKNGDRFEMKSPYTSEDEINQLIKELGLKVEN